MKTGRLLAGLLTVILAASAMGAEFADPKTPATPEPTHAAQPAAKETWYRVYMWEYDNGRKRSAGTFENPDYGRCLRHARGWVEGDPKRRGYDGPYSFQR
jgi:hypothetical protein